MNYQEFLSSKIASAPATGIANPGELGDHLSGFQRDCVGWGLRRGRAALFLDTGLGKTRCQLEWSRKVVDYLRSGGADFPPRALVLAPLAVAKQTVEEGSSVGIEARYCRAQREVQDGITVTNYEMLHRFDPANFGAVVLDESSILKGFDSATRAQLVKSFRDTPFKLPCSATPSPNDFTELGNHAEFLGVMTRAEMLATFFVHDGGSTQDWRLKGHARDAFWLWVCSWAALVKRPSDLGYPDDGYALPELRIVEHIIQATEEQARAQGLLFAEPARTLPEQRAAKRASLRERVAITAKLANNSKDPWLVWCELNDESSELTSAIPAAVEIVGSMSPEKKADALVAFARGDVRVLVTKPSIAGFGMNFQRCAHMAFSSVSHSHEQLYQAIRRCWRFGQKRPVEVHIVASALEADVLANLRRKERESGEMAAEMSKHTSAIVRAQVRGSTRDTTEYRPAKTISLPDWLKEAS